ncbi:MAG: hypothetical protein HYS32_02645 [Candidatus Woesearchaeota archaeon]|nr:MAG: hypothetical protein HYS32_02645 [Candidatus Woesearchaeota archaeon]
MTTKLSSIIIVLFSSFIASIGQIFFKFSADFTGPIYLNYFILIGLFFYGFGGLIFLIALKDGELSVLYPVLATSYIWATLLAIYIFNDSFNTAKSISTILLIIGVGFIGKGREK